MRSWLDTIFPSLRRRGIWEVEQKINELRDTLVSINWRLRVALGEPCTERGRYRRGPQDMAKTLDEALEAVRKASTRTDSIIADRAEIKQQLADALSGVTLPADVQAKIDEIFDIETADAKKIDDALNTGVPGPSV